MVNPSQPVERLETALRRFRQRHERVRPLWSDRVGQAFERRYIEPLLEEADVTLKEMQRLAEVLAKAWKNTP